MDSKKSIRISLILTDVFIVLLIVMVIALPWMVSWYVETMKRSATLPTTIMVTCYPCSPFVAFALLRLRKLLKNITNCNVFTTDNLHYLKSIAYSCIIITAITLVAGRFYLPFYIVGGTFAFLSLITFSFQGILGAAANCTLEDKE